MRAESLERGRVRSGGDFSVAWSATRSDRLRQVAGVVTFGLVLGLNGVAGSGGLSGESIGEIANRYPSAFRPASYVSAGRARLPLVLAWALVGIAVRYPSTPLLTVPAWTLTAAAAIIVVVARRTRNRRAGA